MLRLTLDEDEQNAFSILLKNNPHNLSLSPNSVSRVLSTIKDPGRIEIYGKGPFVEFSDIDGGVKRMIRDEFFTFLFSLGYNFEFFRDFNPDTIHDELINRSVSVVIVDESMFGTIKTSFLFDPDKLSNKIRTVMLSNTWPDKVFKSFWHSRGVEYIFPLNVSPLELINAVGSGIPVESQVEFTVDIELSEKVIPIATNDLTKFTISVPSPVTYTVNLTVQGIPALSTCIPIPSSGTPPFEGFLKTNIGISTVDRRHAISLIGQGAGFRKSDTIVFIV